MEKLKATVMIIGLEQKDINIEIDEIKIQQVNTFQYLGATTKTTET